MTEMDTSRAPRGVLAAQLLIEAVAERGDLAERHYLELKSKLDLSTKRDKEKIAKFILGASNRLPDVAATAFEGYGVMVVGVAEGSVTGIQPVEMMEISKVIQQYVGAAGPRWDILWVPIENSSNQVLLVLVDPPKQGQGPFPCRASGESLTDGRIYIRADGETREAKAEELDLLIQRGLSAVAVDVDFRVEVIGEISAVSMELDRTLDAYLRLERDRLILALPKKRSAHPPAAKSPTAGGMDILGIQEALSAAASISRTMMEPEKRTEQEYLDSIERWVTQFRLAWSNALPKIIGSQLKPSIVRITNRTTTFFHDVELQVHLAGDISAVDYQAPKYVKSFKDLGLPLPPREWGPRQRSFDLYTHHMNAGNFHSSLPRPYIPPSIKYSNGGSVTLNVAVGELRPRASFESEGNELVLLVGDHTLSTIRGTWELTARDHNDVYSGEICVEVDPVRDLTPAAQRILGIPGTATDANTLDRTESPK